VSNEQQNENNPELVELGRHLGNIFMPLHSKQLLRHYKGETYAKFVHYTSAESALKIIRTKRLWMRNTNCMADYREVQHGFDILNKFFTDATNQKAFTTALDACTPGAALEAVNLFVAAWKDIRFNTYISAISEHDDDEDAHGRLSMWRASGSFGGSVPRVGIVMKVPALAEATSPLNVLFNSVAYLSEKEAHKLFLEVIANVNAESDFLRTVDRPYMVRIIFAMLLAGVVCLKHEGFREEREWRAIYSPKRVPSTLMECSTEVVAGVPQVVYEIPLDASVSPSLAHLDFSRLFHRLIIGPSHYPWPMYEAFVPALIEAGIADAGDRVVVSGIPIRSA
jgi:hypothetical protein